MKGTETEAKQALRMRRFLMSATTYFFCAILAQWGAFLGYLPLWTPLWWAVGVTVLNVGFFLMIRSGKNLQLRDPSMTEVQLVCSLLAAMVFISQADEARGVMLMFLPVPLLFGILRLNFREMARVALVGFIGYVAVILFLWTYQPQRIKLPLELFQLVALGTVMVFVCLMSGYISHVRAELGVAVKKIEELAHRDSLTGLFNRRHLMERLEMDIARYSRQRSRGVALCMVDLDHFKRINDSFGHPVGDQVLVEVGNCLVKSTREIDCVARYGGEEFIVLLDGLSEDLALSTGERIRAQIGRLQIPALEGQAMSVSIGIAYLKSGESPPSLIERADKALYLAKTGGRNRVIAAA
jgi:diguanylate cyclase (GGDEF)-like protein